GSPFRSIQPDQPGQLRQSQQQSEFVELRIDHGHRGRAQRIAAVAKHRRAAHSAVCTEAAFLERAFSHCTSFSQPWLCYVNDKAMNNRCIPAILALAALPLLAQPDEREKRIAWWREARFGMFIHWGLYAIPAGEWKGRPIPGIGEWIMNRARIPVAE